MAVRTPADSDGTVLPSNKTIAGAVASALGLIIVWALRTYAHQDIPDAVAGAGVSLLTLLVAYLVPETRPSVSAMAAARAKLGLARAA
jgi:hypothetical protein